MWAGFHYHTQGLSAGFVLIAVIRARWPCVEGVYRKVCQSTPLLHPIIMFAIIFKMFVIHIHVCKHTFLCSCVFLCKSIYLLCICLVCTCIRLRVTNCSTRALEVKWVKWFLYRLLCALGGVVIWLCKSRSKKTCFKVGTVKKKQLLFAISASQRVRHGYVYNIQIYIHNTEDQRSSTRPPKSLHGDATSCHDDNPWCHQWRQRRSNQRSLVLNGNKIKCTCMSSDRGSSIKRKKTR